MAKQYGVRSRSLVSCVHDSVREEKRVRLPGSDQPQRHKGGNNVPRTCKAQQGPAGTSRDQSDSVNFDCGVDGSRRTGGRLMMEAEKSGVVERPRGPRAHFAAPYHTLPFVPQIPAALRPNRGRQPVA